MFGIKKKEPKMENVKKEVEKISKEIATMFDDLHKNKKLSRAEIGGIMDSTIANIIVMSEKGDLIKALGKIEFMKSTLVAIMQANTKSNITGFGNPMGKKPDTSYLG